MLLLGCCPAASAPSALATAAVVAGVAKAQQRYGRPGELATCVAAPAGRRARCGGCRGRITLAVVAARWIALLVWQRWGRRGSCDSGSRGFMQRGSQEACAAQGL